MLSRLLSLALTLAGLLAAPRLEALIVHEGRIVEEWPDASPASPGGRALGKAAAAAATLLCQSQGRHLGTHLAGGLLRPGPRLPHRGRQGLAQPEGLHQDGMQRIGAGLLLRVSNGKLDFQNEVYGYYRAKQPKAYYEGGSGYDRAGELLNEMIAYFDPLVDFSKFDNDKDGRTEAVSIVYAGTGQTWGQGLWPHAGSLNRKLDGVTVSRYMMTDLGTRFGLYVFAHECGHMIFGWPDLYYFGDYCLMGNRIMDQNPVAINDFYRADQGWIPAVEVDRNTSAGYSLSAGQGGFRYANPAKAGELFFWSNLKNTGRWSGLKGKGLILYHFDKSKASNGSGTNRSLFVVEADGANNLAADQWPNPGSSAADFFPYGGKPEFSQATSTASRWNDGSASGLRIHSISPAGDVMSFAVGLGTVRVASARRHGTERSATFRRGPALV